MSIRAAGYMRMDADARWLVVARGSFGNVRPLIETFGRIRGFR